MRSLLICLLALGAGACADVAAQPPRKPVQSPHKPAPPVAARPCVAAAGPELGTPTTGAVRGTLCDTTSGERVIGATVVAVSPALAGEQVTISDENGEFTIVGLPPGTYTLTFYLSELTVVRTLTIPLGATTTLIQRLDQQKASAGETIQITGSAPTIDPTSTTQGITIDRSYTRNIPIPGRTFSGVIGSSAGTQADGTDAGPSTEAYSRIDDNPFEHVSNRPLSTFSIDVDTAAYSNTRRFLRDGQRPPKDAVRIEELLNYFRYAYPAPQGTTPFTLLTEVGPSPWNPRFKLVRIGMQTQAIADENVPPRNLVFLLDVSGSMDNPKKLPMLKQAMGLVVDTLRPQDRIAIVVYAGASGVALPPTAGTDKGRIRAALASLEAGGSTNGAAGIELAYQLARKGMIKGGINRVILCTDGDFNVGTTSDGELTRLIEAERGHGVFLTVLGFGMGNLKDATMERLADRGNGNYGYIDSIDEARKLLVKEAGATLVTVAKDVKLQIELNPARVAGYRLLGYENRKLADQDFADDAKDAGELGAGHAVTALYEIVPAGVPVPAVSIAKLKYQAPPARTVASASTELLTIKVRYKAPHGTTSKLTTRVVSDRAVTLAQTSTDFRWASAVVGFGMLLRDSPERGNLSWAMVSALARGATGSDAEGYRKEFVTLAATAATLK